MSEQSTATIPEIEFRDVSLAFDGKPALVGVTFSLNHGEMILITGLAASGKSVLLHLAIGLIRPDSGQILVRGEEIDRMDESKLLGIRGDRMGLVFQEQALFTGMTVYENAAYRLREHNWPEDKLDKAVHDVLSFVGLDNDVDKLPEELSGGMQRRLEVARALAGWPPIMLLDEPTGGLDPLSNKEVLDLVIRARDIHKISSLYVTKELHEIPYLSRHGAVTDGSGDIKVKEAESGSRPLTRVMLLETGRIAFTGNLEEFESSTNPAVLDMKGLNVPMPEDTPLPPDPWKKRPGSKSGIW